MRLPERPDLEQLSTRARELQRAVRTGEPAAVSIAGTGTAVPDYPLHAAQLALARQYGCASWQRLRQQVIAINERSWAYSEPPVDEPLADRFLRLACLNYAEDSPRRRDEAARLLAGHPDLPSAGVAVAAACADLPVLRRLLSRDPGAAVARTGPYDWPALMYLTYARLDVDRDATLAAAQLLLASGADPNDGRFFLGLATPFTVLTGCLGSGEGEQPPHPHAMVLARLLLAAGAEANDGQVLYNRMFGEQDDFLELLFEFGLGRGDGGPWRRLLPDLLSPPAVLLGELLRWAVLHDQRDRVALMARHDVDLDAPIEQDATALTLALRNGHRRLAEQLRALGAGERPLDPVEAFIGAALAGRAAEVAATPAEVVHAARLARPALVVWAAGQQRIEAVDLLVAAGFDVNAFGRSDLPIEQEWQTALHAAVERGNAPLVRRLLELGADSSLRDTRFGGTPLDWAGHLQRPELVEFFHRS